VRCKQRVENKITLMSYAKLLIMLCSFIQRNSKHVYTVHQILQIM